MKTGTRVGIIKEPGINLVKRPLFRLVADNKYVIALGQLKCKKDGLKVWDLQSIIAGNNDAGLLWELPVSNCCRWLDIVSDEYQVYIFHENLFRDFDRVSCCYFKIPYSIN